MPYQPKAPCRTPRCRGRATRRGLCENCSREDERTRGSAATRGYDAYWRKRRLEFIASHPTCDECPEPTAEPDHIVPVREARAQGWTETRIHADENLRPKCKTHHSRRTALEQSGWGPKAQRYVVIGPKGFGKTTWVEQRQRPGDLVWDLDKVARVISQIDAWPRPPHVISMLMHLRDTFIKELESKRESRAFVIVTNATEGQQIAQRIGALVVLPTTLAESGG